MQIKDQLQRDLYFPHPPKRIVSLVPSQTELLVDLGLKESLVGITKFCVHPESLRKDIAVVGGTKNVKEDKIAALRPDVIICNKEENTQEMVETLSEMAPVWVSDIETLDNAYDMIAALGSIFSVTEKAEEMVSSIKKEVASFRSFMEGRSVKKVAYVIWKDPLMLAGKGTFINTLLKENKLENICSGDRSRYPEVSIEFLSSADLVYLSSEPYPFKERHRKEFQDALDKEVTCVDGEYFSWYGSRLQEAFGYFRSLHSD